MDIVVPDEFKYLYGEGGPRDVVKVPAQVLREVARPIEKIGPKVINLAESMVKIMKAANGIGLAAPQVGVSQRIIVIAPEGIRPTVLINPEIVSREGSEVGAEGCLSIPGLYGDVERALHVVVHATDRKGREMEYELTGLPARVVQHEIDHLDGKLFIDIVDPTTLHWEHPATYSPR